MSYKLVSLFILPTLLFAFGLNASENPTNSYSEVEIVQKVYVTPEDVLIGHEGIFVADEEGVFQPIEELHADAKGTYIWKPATEANVLGSWPSTYDYGIYRYLEDQRTQLI